MTDRISGFRSRAQVVALNKKLDDALGNRDGVPGNETRPDRAPTFFDRQPMLSRLKDALGAGLSASDEAGRLNRFVDLKEAEWGRPVTSLPPGAVANHAAFRADKAIALTRFDRHPKDVTDGFVTAKGSVDGQPIADRQLFFQRWKPVGEPSGKVVVVSPGFQETGRNFYEQIDLLNRQGHDVVVMDHQWAGHSQGEPGGLDRGFGVARDVAAVAAMAAELAQAEYGDKAKVVLYGNSMGAGPGVLGALTLNDAGKIQLDGAQMPKGLDAVLYSPYLKMSPGLINGAIQKTGKVPLVKDLALPAAGLPVLSKDPVVQAKLANHAVVDDIVARPQAMSAATADLARIQALIAGGQGPTGKIAIVHSESDPLASPDAAKALAQSLGGQANLTLVPGSNHVLEESPTAQRHLLDALNWLS